jgi:hypothetical protein
VVDDKTIPFTTVGLKEWYERMQCVLGTAFVPGVDAEVAWRAQSPEALREIAARYRAGYILTRDEWHPTLSGRKIDAFHGWSIWELSTLP